jgi:hypothetical protein
LWDHIPGAWPSPVFDLVNWGASSRSAAMSVRGLGRTLEEVAKRQEKKPAWDNIIFVESAAAVGLNCQGDFSNAAILFQQPNHEQPIKWLYRHKKGQPPEEALLTVSKETGEFTFSGGGMRVNGPVTAVRGISGSTIAARNLCGKNIAVAVGKRSFAVKFSEVETDADYAVLIEQSWFANRAVANKRKTGFTVVFDKPAPRGATIDWMIIR